MKKIKLYACYKLCNSIASFFSIFCLSELQSEYEFIWDCKEPDYLIATEHIYYDPKCKKEFKKLYTKAKITIFWAGECIFPDMNMFDYAVCWDTSFSLNDRICRITPEIFNIFKTNYHTIETLDEAKNLLKEKNGFCNFIYSNPNAHPMRDRIFKRLSQYKKVDSLGKHLNNVSIMGGTGLSGHEKETTFLKEKYKFSIAAENAICRGYTSEKLMTSLQAHTVPIYWGNPDVENEYNEKAFINANKYKSLDDLADYIKKIDQSEELWCEYICQPMHTEQQKKDISERIKKYKDFFRYIFKQSTDNAKRKPEGYHPGKYRKYFFLPSAMWSLTFQEWKRNIYNYIIRLYTGIQR